MLHRGLRPQIQCPRDSNTRKGIREKLKGKNNKNVSVSN